MHLDFLRPAFCPSRLSALAGNLIIIHSHLGGLFHHLDEAARSVASFLSLVQLCLAAAAAAAVASDFNQLANWPAHSVSMSS